MATPYKKQQKNTRSLFSFTSESGGVFTALLAGVVMAAALSLVLYQTISGPMATMAKATNAIAVKSQLRNVASAIMADTAAWAGNDCDSDMSAEPREWRTGVGPTNGGLVPNNITLPTAELTDPWGTEYGYCVWDMGSHNDPTTDNGCGVGEHRLKGNSDPVTVSDLAACTALHAGDLHQSCTNSQTLFAVISAGPDRQFQTTCNDYTNNSTDLISTNGDDIVQRYTYNEVLTNTCWGIALALQEL